MPKVRPSFVVLALGVLCLVTGIQSRAVAMVGGCKFEISDDQFLCDKIECPTNTSYCIVTKKKDPQNATVLVRSNICYSSTNEVLKDLVTKETIDANSNVNVNIKATRNGNSQRITTGADFDAGFDDDFDEEKFNKEFSMQMSNFQQELSTQMQNLHDNMNKMQQQLGNLFH